MANRSWGYNQILLYPSKGKLPTDLKQNLNLYTVNLMKEWIAVLLIFGIQLGLMDVSCLNGNSLEAKEHHVHGQGSESHHHDGMEDDNETDVCHLESAVPHQLSSHYSPTLCDGCLKARASALPTPTSYKYLESFPLDYRPLPALTPPETPPKLS